MLRGLLWDKTKDAAQGCPKRNQTKAAANCIARLRRAFIPHSALQRSRGLHVPAVYRTLVVL